MNLYEWYQFIVTIDTSGDPTIRIDKDPKLRNVGGTTDLNQPIRT